jgi:SSS family solute:Na+ symporter
MIEIIILGIFGLFLLLISVYGYKISVKTAEDYMLAGRRIGIFVMFFFALFSISSAWTFYGYPGFLYRHGAGFVYFIWGCVAGFVLLYMFIGPRLWAVAKLNRFLSPVEVIAQRYESPVLRLIISIILLASIIPYMADQSLGVGLGFAALTGKPQWRIVGIIYLSVLLIMIVLLGGMRITAWVNVLLGTIYTTAFLGALIWVLFKLFPGGILEAISFIPQQRMTIPGPEGKFTPPVMSILFFVGLLALTWPHVAISTMTAQDKSIFKWMPGLALIVAGIFFYTIPFIWGAILSPAISELKDTKVKRICIEDEIKKIEHKIKIGDMSPISQEEIELKADKAVKEHCDKIVQKVVTAHLPFWAGIFVLMGVIGAALSTAAVQLMTSSIIVARDIVHGFFKPKASDFTLLVITKIAVILIVIISFGIAVWYPIALAEYLVNIAVPGFAQWGPAFVGGILWKGGTKKGAIAGTSAGAIVLIICFMFNILPGKAIIPALGINIILYIVISLLTQKPSKEVLRKFFDEVEDFLSKKG